MEHDFRVSVASPPDRENLVAEIFVGNEQFAEVNQEQSALHVEIYPRQNGQPWLLTVEDVTEALNQARVRLRG